MIRISNIELRPGEDEARLVKVIEKKLSCAISGYKIYKKSIDARKKADIKLVYTVDVNVPNEATILKKKLKNVTIATYKPYTYAGVEGNGERVLIVGFGPAGMFCALEACKHGYKPIVVERGKCVEDRVSDVNLFNALHKLNPESNIQFGEGGAGTFSDGKLTTGIKDVRVRYVFEELVRHGAPKEIMYDAMPHIGTDNLREVVKAIRASIISMGGEVHFSTRLDDVIIEDDTVVGAMLSTPDGLREAKCSSLILCTGHSARDTFKMLHKRGVKMAPKAFSLGARIEHPREVVNHAMYGGVAPLLPSAYYKLSTHLDNGRGVYTFCMCPGGVVVNATSEEGSVVTNGMSYYKRDAENSNSALLVGITPDDYGNTLFGGMELQNKIEKAAYGISGDYLAPCTTVGALLNGSTPRLGSVKPSVEAGYNLTTLDNVLPKYITDAMAQGILAFDKKLNGFAMADAVITAPETRSSSPITILRDKDTLKTNIKGLYCAGEGGGHAGGIISSAVDGIKVVEKLKL